MFEFISKSPFLMKFLLKYIHIQQQILNTHNIHEDDVIFEAITRPFNVLINFLSVLQPFLHLIRASENTPLLKLSPFAQVYRHV